MRSSDRKVNDLTSSNAIDLSGFSIQSSTSIPITSAPESCYSGLEINLSIGFLGYDASYPAGTIRIDKTWLQSKEVLRRRIFGRSVRTLAIFGLVNDSRMYGWEVQYLLGYASLQGSVKPQAFAIIDTVEAFKVWIDQYTKEMSPMRSMVVRFVRKDGVPFDTSYRTNKESIAERNLTNSLNDVESALKAMSMSDIVEVKRDVAPIAREKTIRKTRSNQVNVMLKGRAEAGILSLRERARLARNSPPPRTPFPSPRTPALRARSLPDIDLRESFLAVNERMDLDTGKTQDTEMGNVL